MRDRIRPLQAASRTLDPQRAQVAVAAAADLAQPLFAAAGVLRGGQPPRPLASPRFCKPSGLREAMPGGWWCPARNARIARDGLLLPD